MLPSESDLGESIKRHRPAFRLHMVDVHGGFNLNLICMTVASAKQQLVGAVNLYSETVFLVAEIQRWWEGTHSDMNLLIQIVIWQTGIGWRFFSRSLKISFELSLYRDLKHQGYSLSDALL